MSLQSKFDIEIPDGFSIEFPKDSGIYHIPILRVKEMLSQDFTNWGTDNFKIEIFTLGSSCMINCSVQLNLNVVDVGVYTFVGAYTFNISRYQDNQDWSATGLSECIKNAAKNIGRKYGMYLNQGMVDIQSLQLMKEGNFETKKSKKESISKAITRLETKIK